MTSEVTQAALEPCPFCGSGEIETYDGFAEFEGEADWAVFCNMCEATVCGNTEAEAITAWNTRLTAQSGEGRSGADYGGKICDGEWLPHTGADCPVALLSLVEIKHRAGSTAIAVAGTLIWQHGRFIPDAGNVAPEADIVAYRRVNVTKLNAALNARQSGEREPEKFLTAYVSEDSKIIGIEHDTDADWHKVHDAHIALWNRLEERIREREKCPRKPALRATDDAGGVE